MLRAINKFSALDLLYDDEYLAAGEMLGLRVGEWPENRSEGNSDYATALLVAGVIASALGGMRHTGTQEAGKEMLSESIRLFGDRPEAQDAKGWLAFAHQWTGEYREVLTITDELIDATDERLRFRVLLVRVQAYSRLNEPHNAVAMLKEMEQVYEGQSELLKGKFHCQRARVLRETGETDPAIIDYEAAIHFFQQSQNARCEAIVANNLAGVYLETEQFDRAHEYAKQAQELFSQLGEKTYEAKAWDQRALTFLAEREFLKAQWAIDHAIELVSHGEVLGECLLTLAKIKRNVALCAVPHNATMSGTSGVNSPTTLPLESDMNMLDCARQIIQGDPDNALRLLHLLAWATADRGDPQHEAELSQIERLAYSYTDDSEQHRESLVRSLLIRSVT